VCGCLSLCGPVMDWWPVQGVPRLLPDDRWDRLQPHRDPTDGLSGYRKWMDGFLTGPRQSGLHCSGLRLSCQPLYRFEKIGLFPWIHLLRLLSVSGPLCEKLWSVNVFWFKEKKSCAYSYRSVHRTNILCPIRYYGDIAGNWSWTSHWPCLHDTRKKTTTYRGSSINTILWRNIWMC